MEIVPFEGYYEACNAPDNLPMESGCIRKCLDHLGKVAQVRTTHKTHTPATYTCSSASSHLTSVLSEISSVQQAHNSDSILAAVRPQDTACLTTFQQMEQAVSVSAFAGICFKHQFSSSRSFCENTNTFCS